MASSRTVSEYGRLKPDMFAAAEVRCQQLYRLLGCRMTMEPRKHQIVSREMITSSLLVRHRRAVVYLREMVSLDYLVAMK